MANKKAKHSENVIPIRDLLFHCISKWYWFAISLGAAIGTAVIYILSTPPVYVRSTEILIKEENKNGGSGAFKDFAAGRTTADVSIETKALRSPGIVREAIDRLNLEIDYKGEGRFYNGIIYSQRPIKATTHDLRNSDAAQFAAVLSADSSFTLSEFSRNGIAMDGIVNGHIGDTISTPVGRISIHATEHYGVFTSQKIFVEKKNLNATINEYCSKIISGRAGENTSIVRLTIKDQSTIRATEILNTIIAIYNEQWLIRNNESAVKTIEFINQRIDSLQIELNTVDREIAAQNSKNKLTAKQISELSNEFSSNNNAKLIELSTQLELGLFLKKCLIENAGNKELLPSKTGIGIASVENMITNYNQEIINRDKYLSNSSEANPIVIDCNNNLAVMYKSINDALDGYISNLQRETALLEKEDMSDKAQFSKDAEQVKNMQSLLRQQKVKNALYLFLLQKLEETELSKEFEASNNRVLVPVGGSNTPVEPMQRQTIMLALAIGALLPILIIFVREITNRKVRGRKDLEEYNIPFIGEIPQYEPGKKLKFKNEEKKIIVKEGNRNIINEAFRVLRTNLEFMNDKEKSSNIIILTSFNPGSGKTFLTMNIAASLALKGARVLVIDGDLRHGSASGYANSPEVGLSDYLSGGTDDAAGIIADIEEFPTLKLIPIGSTPPNPTELLHSKRFGKLIENMRNEFEYILIDCPPIDIVADTQIIEEHADRTVFVVRAGLLNRDMLVELEDIYDNKRFKNLAMILNGTHGGGTGYRYKYGYSYSYSYGYGYGYGYHYHQKK